ncbi:MAG TPA: ASCH domain-containing protein [Fimbriimonadales bacterium]|nr:ASCH domain-containing protein [Fimbriimonadales bacterium]
MYALNFYPELYAEALRTHRKTVTIRLGDKSYKYREGELVWVTVGPRFGLRQKLYTAVIDRVELKTIGDLSRRDIERENPEFRTPEDVRNLLQRIYNEQISLEHLVTVIHFSAVQE